MNKVIKGLLITALTLSAQNVAAHTNKTFLQPRNQALVNLPLIDTTWSERKCAKLEDRFGGNFQITGFYGQSTDNNNTGKYFGVNNLNEFALTTGATLNNASSSATTVDPSYLVHINDATADTSVATVKLSPRVTHYGVNLAYFQDLSKIVNGLYMQVVLPINHVENDVRFNLTAGTDAGSLTSAELTNFFAGTHTKVVANDNAQDVLKFAKIRTGKDSATGVADIDVLLGYKLLKKEKYHLGLNIAISIPTGNEPSGEYLFDAVYGSKHFGLGGGLHAGARVWGDEDHNFKLALNANYRYMFEASEKRTLGLANRNWSQYYGTVVAASNAKAQQVVPLANLTTLNCDVEPGSQVDGVINLAYNKGGFNFGLGYNMYYREAESVSLKSGQFTDGVIALVARSKKMSEDDKTNMIEGAALKAADLSTASAATPSQFTHSVFGGLGYAFKNWEYPLMLGLGGKYEFADKNSALEGWQGWIKAGISF